jgi:hypothetical protein
VIRKQTESQLNELPDDKKKEEEFNIEEVGDNNHEDELNYDVLE